MTAASLPAPAPRSIQRYVRQATTCPQSGKRGFRTKGKALKVSQRLSQATGDATYVYLCSCGAWHLTRQVGRAKAA